MTFADLLNRIETKPNSVSKFEDVCKELEKDIFAIDRETLIPLITQIGAIPESIEHDSTEEKLFAKTADIVLARSLHELGLRAQVIKERSDCADVVCKSDLHNYDFVGDAKAFRLSRTAKNQKDFKVSSLNDWKQGRTFAVLVCPYFQYPKKKSQIYAQALQKNVCLLSWEHLLFFIQSGIRESLELNLSKVWGISQELSEQVKVSDRKEKDNFHQLGNELICQHLSLDYENLKRNFLNHKTTIVERADKEILFWEQHITEVRTYTREQAINELISALKIEEKIKSINDFKKKLPPDNLIG